MHIALHYTALHSLHSLHTKVFHAVIASSKAGYPVVLKAAPGPEAFLFPLHFQLCTLYSTPLHSTPLHSLHTLHSLHSLHSPHCTPLTPLTPHSALTPLTAHTHSALTPLTPHSALTPLTPHSAHTPLTPLTPHSALTPLTPHSAHTHSTYSTHSGPATANFTSRGEPGNQFIVAEWAGATQLPQDAEGVRKATASALIETLAPFLIVVEVPARYGWRRMEEGGGG
jgi:hypothetical protein